MTKKWLVAICVVFIVSFCVQVLLEYLNKSDSIGILYSVYCAALYTLLCVLLVKLIVSILRRLRAHSG
jgi:hypothetical protein